MLHRNKLVETHMLPFILFAARPSSLGWVVLATLSFW
jgi:hypothetical protein